MVEALTPLAEGLWTASQPLRFFQMEIGARMTVVRLPGGDLWLHSPIDPTPELREAVAKLGTVRHAVAPNRMHHLFVDRWSDAGPDVRIHLAPGLGAKRPDLAGATELGDQPDPAWAGVIDQELVRGMPLANEIAFLHRPSGTLLLCDLAFNVGPGQPWWTRLWMQAVGVREFLSTTFIERLITRDRAAARASLERILAWEFDRVVVAHREVVESGGREALRRAWSWLL